jgi:hypothetical protein
MKIRQSDRQVYGAMLFLGLLITLSTARAQVSVHFHSRGGGGMGFGASNFYAPSYAGSGGFYGPTAGYRPLNSVSIGFSRGGYVGYNSSAYGVAPYYNYAPAYNGEFSAFSYYNFRSPRPYYFRSH